MARLQSDTITAKTTMAERVWLQLAAEIVSGGVKGGRRLDEVEQSQRLGVSRTPLRESLRQLAALGLVENRPHRGVVVAEGVGDSLFQVLAELEAACARTVAGSLNAEERKILAGLDVGQDDILGWLRQANGNSVLRGLLHTLWYPLQAGGGRLGFGVASLRRLIEAVVAGDGEAAERAVRDHVAQWHDRMLLPPRQAAD